MATKDKLRNDLKKLQEALKKESIPSDLKTKIKSQIERVEKELKSAKPTKTATTTAATTKVLLGKLQKFVEKNKKYGSYGKTSESNLQKDAVRTALKIGKRTSEGKRSNQFGTKGSNKGNTYYEYRTNRHDVKQPKSKQTYPILEDGGMMAKGGMANNFQKNGNRLMYFEPINEREVIVAFINESSKIVSPTGVYYLPHPIAKDVIKWANKNGYEFMQDDKKYADGGMMAKGGKLKVNGEDFSFLLELSDKELSKKLDLVRNQKNINAKQYFSAREKGESTTKIEESGNNLDNQERAIIEARIRKNKMAEGGMMAKGGSLNTYKLRAEGLNDFLSFLQTGMYMRMKSFTIEPIGVPDVVVSFVTDASLSEIKSKLKEVTDSHVMLETIKPINEYTGERDRMMAKGGGVKEVFEQYEENEDNNLHSENVVLLAKHFGTKDDIKKAEMILKKHEEIGHIPYDLMKERDELGHKLHDKLLAAKNKKMAGGGDTDGKYGYVAFYKGKRIEVYADTSYEAQKKAAEMFKAKKSWDVHVVLAEVGGKPYVNTAYAMGGAIDVLGNTAGANLQNVGGTMFSSADLTDNLTIDNTGFFKKGGVVSKNHRTNS